MDDDFNTSMGQAALFELVRAINTGRDAGVTGPFYEAAQRTLHELAGIFGITLDEPVSDAGHDMAAKPFIDLLVEVRGDMRTVKQWAAADKIRNKLKEMGVVMEDTPEGTVWRFEESV